MAKPKIADVKAKLEELGIVFDKKAKLDELLALLPEDARAELTGEEEEEESEDEEEGEEGDEEEEESAAADKKGKPAVVLSRTGSVARTYNKTDHGPKYRDLAAEYAKKIGGSVQK